MARDTKTKSVDVVTDNDVDVKTEKKETSVSTTIGKDEIIEVISLIPNVSYKDTKYGDIYKWEKADEVVEIPFDVLNTMWQKYKTYFKSMWLKPLDERVVKKFALEKTYRDYDFLMDASNYNRKNINEICDNIRRTPSSLKLTVCNKVKSFVSTGEVSDIMVLREIEKSLNIDLIPLIGY